MNAQLQNAFLGSLVADAVAMPVHWYYDRHALDRDYGELNGYVGPKNPHPDSILWRSHYTASNPAGEILHDQAQYWGQRGIHYHQFLAAGDNTINYLLAVQLYRSTVRSGGYDPDEWLKLYIQLMQKPGWHQDTYLEEYHRAFFDRLASGKKPRDCGIDDLHIGGVATVPALIAALDALQDEEPTVIHESTIRNHAALTHQNPHIDQAVIAMVRILQAIANGSSLHDAITEHAKAFIGQSKLKKMALLPDRQIIGRHYTPACYLPESFTASLCLAWKYADDFTGGIIANAKCGGDNCHRGAVVGSLLGASVEEIPERWLRELKSIETLRCDTLDPIF